MSCWVCDGAVTPMPKGADLPPIQHLSQSAGLELCIPCAERVYAPLRVEDLPTLLCVAGIRSQEWRAAVWAPRTDQTTPNLELSLSMEWLTNPFQVVKSVPGLLFTRYRLRGHLKLVTKVC